MPLCLQIQSSLTLACVFLVSPATWETFTNNVQKQICSHFCTSLRPAHVGSCFLVLCAGPSAQGLFAKELKEKEASGVSAEALTFAAVREAP